MAKATTQNRQATDQLQADQLKIGERLLELRKSRGLTLASLAKLTGISEATLSRAENDIASPNAHNLYVLAKALDVDVTTFFRTDSVSFGAGLRSITRRDAGEKRSTGRYDFELLCADLAHKNMMPSKNRIVVTSLEDAGGLRGHEGEEFVYVLNGALYLHSEQYVPALLETGDSMYFDSNMPHAYVAVDDNGADILSITMIPS
jgi:transcriptional regulator with XRE-family HTH domain